MDLDVGVRAGRDPAEDLQQGLLAERDRGVGLLTGERRGLRGRVERLAREPVEGERAVGREGERPEVRRHRLAVVHGVVGVGPADLGVLPPADEGVVEPVLGVGVERQRHLVDLDVAVGVGHLGQVDDDARVLLGDHPEPAYVGHLAAAALAAEPAGALDEVGELPPVVGGRDVAVLSVRMSSVTGWWPPRVGRSAGTSRTRTHPGSGDTAARRSAGTGRRPGARRGHSPPSAAGRARRAARSARGC